jgi:membrane fusion protein, heavy metal efflux system
MIYEAGAFEEIVDVKAPNAASIPDWDVHEILAKAGDRVETGAKLIELDNWRSLLLKCEAIGSDAAALLSAVQDQQAAEAVPLLRGSGPKLNDLHIERITNTEGAQGAIGYLRISNSLLKETLVEDVKFRTWAVRPGTRYTVRFPVNLMKEVYVLPVDAVTDEGMDKVVYIQDGDNFKAAKVVVLYQDHEIVVLDGKHSEIFPGDSIAQHGAFGLGLALRSPVQEVGDDDDHPHHHH